MNRSVFIALQKNDEARAIIDAIVQDNPGCKVNSYPAMVKIDAEERIVINRKTVSEKIGREWDTQEIHVNLISLGGSIDETDEYFALQWRV